MFAKYSPILNLIILCLVVFGQSCNTGDKTVKLDSQVSSEATLTMKTDTTTSLNKTVLFFGNSLTAGYGLENEEDGFIYILQERVDSLGLPYTLINAGLSGETTAGGKGRIDWVLNQSIDIFVLELGANDMLRGINVINTRENLEFIIRQVQTKNADIQIILAGMKAAPNMGAAYVNEFESIYPQLSQKYSTGLIPFFLKDIASIPSLNQKDGIHPNVHGQLVLAETVWEELSKYLQKF